MYILGRSSPCKLSGIPANTLQGEVFKETKERLSKRTGIRGKQFDKIKFAVVSRVIYSNPRYLEDGACFVSLLQGLLSSTNLGFLADSWGSLDDVLADIATDPDDQLGLDHVNKNRNFWNRSESFFIR